MSIDSTAVEALARMPGEGESISMMNVALTYKVVGAQSGGQWLVLEYSAPPHFAGPPPHVHKVTTEIFYILTGELTVQIGKQTTRLTSGGLAFVPPGMIHAFSNQSDTPARILLVASPAGLENYFTELAEMLKQEPSWPPRDMSKVTALMAKYDTFAPTD
jgi:quercetin dioxygenase-like cupin family protein